MTRSEIDRKLRDIIEFSELESVIDYPFRTYSSGMRARLTFATAISVSPDLLIIDEALAVGDVLFQEKCFRQIREIAKQGTTILFVTHAYPTIYDLCSRAILLHKGEIVADDGPRKVGYAYEKLLAEDRGKNTVELTLGSATHGLAHLDLYIREVGLFNAEGVKVSTLFHGVTYVLRVLCVCAKDCPSLSVGFVIQKPNGHVVYNTASIYMGKRVSAKAGETIEFKFTLPCYLGAGEYFLAVGVSRMKGDVDYEVVHTVREAVVFTVISDGTFGGDVDLRSQILSIDARPLESN